MKPLSLLLLFSVLLIWSCAKEQDTTLTDIEIEEPAPGELIFLSGVVQDSLGAPVAGATVRAFFDDFVYTVTANGSGAYTVGIPASKTLGYVVAAKDDFSRSILEANTAVPAPLRHVLAPAAASDAASWLQQLNVNNLFRVEGRCLSPGGVPLPDIWVTVWSLSPSLPAGFVEQGKALSGPDGSFVIIGEKGSFTRSFAFTLLGDWPCAKLTAEDFDDSQDVTVIDLTVDPDPTEIPIPINVTETGCASPLNIYWTYRPGASFAAITVSGSYEPPSSVKSCSNDDSELFFIGGSTERTSRNFDGGFYRFDAIPNPLVFNLCQPEYYFARVEIDGISHEIQGARYGVNSLWANRLEAGPVGAPTLRFVSDGSNGPINGVQSTDWWYSFGRFETASITVGGQSYTLAPGVRNYYHFNYDVSGSTQDATGIIQGQLLDASGSLHPFKVWFRADKN